MTTRPSRGHVVRVAVIAIIVWLAGAPTPLTGQGASSARDARGQTATMLPTVDG